MPAERTLRGSETAHSSSPSRCKKCRRVSCWCGNPSLKQDQTARVRRSTRHYQQLPPLHVLLPALAVNAEHQNPQVSGRLPTQSVPDLSLLDDDTENGRREDHSAQSFKWRHPAELEYIEPSDWDESRIINYLCINAAFSLPPRDPLTSSFPWVKVIPRNPNDSPITLPRGYRIPLMFTAKFMWESLKLVLESPTRAEDWDECKFDILHVARLCSRFLAEARNAEAIGGEEKKQGGMSRTWRCATFDRTLIRYYRRWLVSREEFVRDFWVEFDEEEFQIDVLKRDWSGFSVKGHKGFHLTKDEIANGISFEQFTHGLTCIDGRWSWNTSLPRYLSEYPTSSPTTATPMDVVDTPNPRPPTTRDPTKSLTRSPSSSPLSTAPSLIDLELDNYSPSLLIKREIIDASLLSDPDLLQTAAAQMQEYTQDANANCERPIVVRDHHQGTPAAYPSPVSDVEVDVGPDNTTGTGEGAALGLMLNLAPVPGVAVVSKEDGGMTRSVGDEGSGAVSQSQGWVPESAGVDMRDGDAPPQPSGTEEETETGKEGGGLHASHDPGEMRSSAASNVSTQEVVEMVLGGVDDATEGEDNRGEGASALSGDSGVRRKTAYESISKVEGNLADNARREKNINVNITSTFVLLRDGLPTLCGPNLPAHQDSDSVHPSSSPSSPSPTRFVLLRGGQAFLGPRPLPIGYCGPAYTRPEIESERKNVGAGAVRLSAYEPPSASSSSSSASTAPKPSTDPSVPLSSPSSPTHDEPPEPVPVGTQYSEAWGERVSAAQRRAGLYAGSYAGRVTEEEADKVLREACYYFAGEMLAASADEGDEWAKETMRVRKERERERERERWKEEQRQNQNQKQGEKEKEKEGNSGGGMGTETEAGKKGGWVEGEGVQPKLGKRKREGGEDGNGSGKRKAGLSDGQEAAPVPDVGLRRASMPLSASTPTPTSMSSVGRQESSVQVASSSSTPADDVMDDTNLLHPAHNPSLMSSSKQFRHPAPAALPPTAVDTNMGESSESSESSMPLPPGPQQRNGRGDGDEGTCNVSMSGRVDEETSIPRRRRRVSATPRKVAGGATNPRANSVPNVPEEMLAVPPIPLPPQAQLNLNPNPNPSPSPSATTSISTNTNTSTNTSTNTNNSPLITPKSTPKLKPQYAKSWNERVAAVMESARQVQVQVRGHEGDGNMDGLLEMMEGLKVPEHEHQRERGSEPEPERDKQKDDVDATINLASTTTETQVALLLPRPPAPMSPLDDAPEHTHPDQARCNPVPPKPMVALVTQDSLDIEDAGQSVANGRPGNPSVADENMTAEEHELPPTDPPVQMPLTVEEQDRRETPTTIEPKVTNGGQVAAIEASIPPAAAGTGVTDKHTAVNELEPPSSARPHAHTNPTVAEQDRYEMTRAGPGVTAVQKVSMHNPDGRQVSAEPHVPDHIDRQMAVDGYPRPRAEDYLLRVRPQPQDDNDTAADAPFGAPSDMSGSSTEVETGGIDMQALVSNLATARGSLQSQPSSNITHADATLVDLGYTATPATASLNGSYHKMSQAHADELSMMAIDPSPVVKKVVSMFRDTLVGLTDILETVGREDAKRAMTQAAPPTPSVTAVPPNTPSTSRIEPQYEASTSTSLGAVSELLDEIKGLRQQIQEDQEQREDRDREVRQLQNEVDNLRRKIGMLDFGTVVQGQTNDDDGMVDMDISPPSSVSASPSALSTPTATWRRRRFRDVDDADRIRSPHPLAHLLAPTLPLPLRLPQRMSRTSITPLALPCESESSRALSIASTPAILTPPPKEVLPSSMAPLRTPSPCPKTVPYNGVPLPIKSQRKQHMFFHPDRQQN